MRRAALALALLALVLIPLGARADTTAANPLLASAVSCTDDTPANGLLPGDTMSCTLTIDVAAGGPDLTTGYASVTFSPGSVTAVPGSCPQCTSFPANGLVWDNSAVGSVAAGTQKSFTFGIKVGSSTLPGTTVSLTALIENLPDGNPFIFVSANYNVVTFFQGSSLVCSDPSPQTPGKILPGDVVSCDLTLVNPLPHDTTGISALVPVPPGTAYASGGSSHTDTAVSFDSSQFPNLPAWSGSGTPPSEAANMTFTILSSTVAGTSLQTTATLGGTNNGTTFTIPVTSNNLVTDPGPANLTKSTLTCRGTSGGTLVAGDDLTCSVVAAPMLGFESITGAQAVAAIPNSTTYVSGGTAHDGSTVTLGPSLLGAVAAGNTKTASFNVRVNPGTPVGTVINDSGTLTAISTPSGKTVGPQALVAPPLTVGFVDPNSANLSIAGSVDKPSGTLTLTGDSTKDRAHIAVTLSNAGPSTSVSPTLTITIPAGVTFEGLDSPDDCSRTSPTQVSCSPGAGTLAPGASYKTGVTVSVQKLTPETYKRVVALDATATTPDPVLPNQSTTVINLTQPARAAVVCLSQRVIVVHIPPPRGQTWRSVAVTLAGKKVKVKPGKKSWSARIVLKGGKPGLATVSITGTTTKGRVVKSKRKYQKCKKKVVKKK
jgi:hypothetical protein